MSLAKPAEAGAAARFASLNIGQNIERLQARPVSVLFRKSIQMFDLYKQMYTLLSRI